MKTPTTETRKGSPLLLVVLVVVSLVVTSVYFREGEAGPLRSTRRGLLFLATPAVAVGNAVATPFESVGRWFGGLSVNRKELDTLRKQNDEMRAALAKMEEERQENVRLRALAKLPDSVKAGSVAAHVIGRSADVWEGTFVIDRGSADGVRPGTPVVAAQGLIGQVAIAAPNSSQVRLITAQTSGVAVLVQSSRATGVVRGSVEGKLTLDFYAGKQLPKPGDVLITSGLGGAYPKGLVVGDVKQAEAAASGMPPRIDVVSRVPLDDVEEVLVLVGMQPSTVIGGIE